MWHKNFKINKSKIYGKIPSTLYSWKIIDKLEALKSNNIMVFEYLKSQYPQQLGCINTMEIINKNWNLVVDEILENNQYLICLNFKDDAIEFKDGIYFINENKFFSFKEKKNQLDTKMSGLNSCVYFNKSYQHLKKPETWLSAITATVQNPDEFCIDFARYFHSDALEKLKKKSLVVVGKSNTGKTTLVANIINNLFGKENVGLVGKNDNFILEQLEDKRVIICDEFDYSKSNRGSLLKLMGNELDLINKKGMKKYSFINKAPIVFLFNPKINKLMLNDDAFKNRFKQYEFQNEITEIFNDIDDVLKKELPNIILYCNRLYFKNMIENNKKIDKKNVENLMISDAPNLN